MCYGIAPLNPKSIRLLVKKRTDLDNAEYYISGMKLNSPSQINIYQANSLLNHVRL